MNKKKRLYQDRLMSETKEMKFVFIETEFLNSDGQLFQSFAPVRYELPVAQPPSQGLFTCCERPCYRVITCLPDITKNFN
jgi:hypothetical protein